MFAAVVSLAMTILATLAAAAAEKPALEWRVWSNADGRPQTVAEFTSAIAGASVLIVGEIHDNPYHHAFRAALLKGVGQRALVFEQLRTDKQAALDAFSELQKTTPEQATLAEFKRLTDWETSGWQQYAYDPLLQTAVDAKLLLYAGDVPRAEMMKVAKEGGSALTAADKARLKLDVPLGDRIDAASLDEIYDAHCKMMPKEALAGMAFAQRYRDATLADTVLKAAERHGSAILLAGNGHARSDRGVPWYIRQRAPDKKVVSVLLVEVADGEADPEAYVPRDPDSKAAADYIIFTPKAERGDPCEKMRKR